MPSVILAPERVTLPDWVVDLESFSKWVDSPGFPDWGRYCYFRGNVWIDTSMEQPFVHNVVKLWISMVLATIARENKLGTFFADKMRLRNDDADLSCEPDGLFVSYAALESGRVRLVPGAVTEYREFEGSPEMTLEVVSDSSEEKDRVDLRGLYFRAGVEEYWLVDARGEPPVLDILRRGPRGYVSARHQAGGWVRSRVFGRAFRLIRTDGPDGNPQFTLEHRD
jgi:Uma2 family endonuclease